MFDRPHATTHPVSTTSATSERAVTSPSGISSGAPATVSPPSPLEARVSYEPVVRLLQQLGRGEPARHGDRRVKRQVRDRNPHYRCQRQPEPGGRRVRHDEIEEVSYQAGG